MKKLNFYFWRCEHCSRGRHQGEGLELCFRCAKAHRVTVGWTIRVDHPGDDPDDTVRQGTYTVFENMKPVLIQFEICICKRQSRNWTELCCLNLFVFVFDSLVVFAPRLCKTLITQCLTCRKWKSQNFRNSGSFRKCLSVFC